MLSTSGTFAALGLLVVLGLATVWLSISLLWRGKLYQRLKPEARPRRWVLLSLLALLLIFVVWFPLWITWPDALISRVLLLLFGVSFGIVGVTFKWLAPFVDAYIERKGWPLR